MSKTEVNRTKPNILITGTPGTGKTTISDLIASASGLKHFDVGQVVRRSDLHSGYDEEYDAYYIDEDKVCDELEDQVAEGGCIVDHHGCDFFPERWFDLVIVLQTDNNILWERLEKRCYSEKKIQENVQCEIMHVVVEEARESYKPDIVHVLSSNTSEEMEANVERILAWIKAWPNKQNL